MKKILALLAIAGMVCTASASSIQWSLKGSSFTTSDGSATRAYDYLVAVVLASDLDAATSAISTINTDSSAFESYVKATGTTTKTGAASGGFTVSDPSGTSISYVLFAFDANKYADAKNYLVSDAVTAVSYEPPSSPTTATYDSATYANHSWTAVPEPSTAALALAGLALLIKRRRA